MTRRLIKQAYIELLQKKSVGQVTVKELCACADVNRSTFYDHYTDFNSILREIEADFLDHMPFFKLAGTKSDLKAEVLSFVRYAKDNSAAFIILIKNGILFDAIYQSALRANVKSGLFSDVANKKARFITGFTVYGTIELLTQWLTDNTAASENEIAKMIIQLSRACYDSA